MIETGRKIAVSSASTLRTLWRRLRPTKVSESVMSAPGRRRRGSACAARGVSATMPRSASASSVRLTSAALPSAGTRRLSASGVGVAAEGSRGRLRARRRSANEQLERLARHARLQLRGGALRDDVAVVDHGDPVGEAVGLLEVLRREQDRRAAGGERLHGLPDGEARLRGSSPVVGSSRKITCGSRDQAHREVQPAAHAAAVGRDAAVGGLGEVEPLEQLGRCGGGRRAGFAAAGPSSAGSRRRSAGRRPPPPARSG